ncbi:hypothetical protein AYL99_05987 [Fonsecaea erecta]|uniref:Uncharacterized protein n=1 Tax=Fonsecaea erecta TaxID=1367422 RepID=A0A178ZP50_9EURO|nr:hypothetical protein AYL99_05987 [Fonsecaea erecta]OAP60983.1 hypothetical protein AYL99_05987 [Fonsecaea erecta]
MSAAVPGQALRPSTKPSHLAEYRPYIENYPWTREKRITFLIGIDFGTIHSTSVVAVADKGHQLLAGSAKLKSTPVGTGEYNSHRIPSKIAIFHYHAEALGRKPRCAMLFGHAVDHALENGKIRDKDVVDLLKLFLFPEYAGSENGTHDPLMRQTRESHERLVNKIKTKYQGQVLYVQPEHGEWGSKTVNNTEDVIVAYFEFIWQETLGRIAEQMEIRQNSGKAWENLRKILKQESHVAVSVPMSWGETTQNRFLELLGRAGLPSSTTIVPEAVAAALCHFDNTSELGDDKDEPLNMIVADIGGATVDVAGVSKYFLDGSARFREIVKQKGILHGSLKLNEYMARHVGEAFGVWGLESVLVELGWTRDKWFRHIKDGFETAKRSFDITENGKEYYRIELPRIDSSADLDYARSFAQHANFILDDTGLWVSSGFIKAVYDTWLQEIIKVIRESCDEYAEKFPNGVSPLLALCGYGSLPPYVLRKCKEEFPKQQVVLVERGEIPLIAMGNIVTLRRADLFYDVLARYSYGIRVDIPWEHVDATSQTDGQLDADRGGDGKYLPDRAAWIIRQGQSLVGPKRLFFLEGRTRLTGSYPFHWDIDILSSSHPEVVGAEKYAAVSRAIEAEKIQVVERYPVGLTYNICGCKSMKSPPGMPGKKTIEIEYRVKMDCTGISPTLSLYIPAKDGTFKKRLDENWEKEDRYTKILDISLGPIHAHTVFGDHPRAQLDRA